MWIEERQVAVADLTPGMYVCRLDRDWVGTPFLLQGFLIESRQEIERLGQYCRYVTIDVQKSGDKARTSALQLESVAVPAPPQMLDVAMLAGARPRPVLAAMSEELPRAREAADRAHALARDILDNLRAGGSLQPDLVGQIVTPLVDSLVRNPDAYFWLEALRHHDHYTYSHAVNCCALMAAFGRHLGFDDAALYDMAAAGLLLDIGKTCLPEALLDSNEALDAASRRQLQEHVQHGLRLYDESGMVNPTARQILLAHHEREDGSGYPQGLKGDAIPLLGRIAAIVDSFDAMISLRPYRRAMSKHEAIQQIYRERVVRYHADLVEQFVQCLGPYPVGTLVELNTGEVAIVMEQNPVRRLFPVVMLLTDAEKQLRNGFETLDLRAAPAAAGAAPLSIRRSLERGSYGLDPRELYL